MEMDGDNPILPQDIVFNILIRLPVKSLIRFRCVCKHWKNLFKTPSFIAEHLQHSTLQNPTLLIGDYDKYDMFGLWLLDREMHVFEVQMDPFINSIDYCVWIIGSCNGLLCLKLSGNSSSLLLVWNPAIRELTQVSRANCLEEGNFCAGFGFSSTVNDYKIVKICVSGNDCLVNQAAVCSLSTGSWRGVELKNLDDLAIKSRSFTNNGAIFWIGLKQGIDVIIAFDIATEVFTFIAMPPSPFSAATDTYHHKYLTVYENNLAMLSHTLNKDLNSSSVHLWVMEEGTGASRERWSWTKKYGSNPCLGLWLLPVTIWRNEIVCNVTTLPEPIDQIEDEALVRKKSLDEMENDKRKIVLINFTTNEAKGFVVQKSTFIYEIFNHVESLVPVKNLHIE